MGRNVLFVVHLRELVDQTVEAFYRLGIKHIGVMRGDDTRIDRLAPVQIASIQTLARRDRPRADVIILDEAHRSISDTYVKNIWEAYPESVIIGLTATPCRGDGRGLIERYEALVVGATYDELIRGKYIADPLVYAPKEEPDMSRCRVRGGDWADEDVAEMMKTIAGHIVPTWLELASGRKTICFASGIDHSKDIVRRFVDAGVTAEHLDGTTPGPEREAVLARLASGETTIVSNCAVLTEGFDMPSIRCAIIARPTMSLVLHMQTAGRALRPGEVQPIIIDHAGNVGRHGLPHEDRTWSLEKGAARKDKNPYTTCKKCFAYYELKFKACPHCGFERPVQPREVPKEVEAKMQVMGTKEIERSFYVSCVSLAQSRGFKPGMASFKFKEKFGRWPPWAWSEETKRLYAEDEDWQIRLTRRVEDKAYWAEGDAKAKAIIAAKKIPPRAPNKPDYAYDCDETDDGIPF